MSGMSNQIFIPILSKLVSNYTVSTGIRIGRMDSKAPSVTVGIEIFCTPDFCKYVYVLASKVLFA